MYGLREMGMFIVGLEEVESSNAILNECGARGNDALRQADPFGSVYAFCLVSMGKY